VNTFVGAFLDFARHTDPNIKASGSILPHWPTWDTQDMREMLFNRTGDDPDIKLSSTPGGLIERCQ